MNKFNPIMISQADVIRELERELETRESLYPRWKLEGKITPNIADHRIMCMKKALELVKKGLPQQKSLFGHE